jgi:hypothetical protein
MPSSVPAVRRLPSRASVPAVRRVPSRASGRALLVATALAAGAFAGLAGPGAAVAAPAPADPAPLVLRDAAGTAIVSGDARADPSFASALFAAGCPADADDAARLSVTSGGATVVTSPSVAVAAGQPVEVPMAISFEEVVAAGVEEGGATLSLECLVVESGIPSTVVVAATLPVTFAAGTWSVPGAEVDPAPPTDDPTAVPTDPGTVPSPAPTDGAGAGADSTPRPSAAVRPSADGALAFTGGQVAGGGALAAGLLAGGTALVLRRRRTAAVDGPPAE